VELLPFYLVAASIGALVGTVEVFQRYRAEPLEAIKTGWAVAYLFLNAFLGALAFYVAVIYGDLNKDSTTDSLLQWSTVSGFGAAAVLRAKLLNIRLSDGKEVALGPEIVVQTFLNVIDRELDRSRAKSRFRAVRKLMGGLDFEKSKNRLPSQIFQAMQRVTEEESKMLMKRVAEVTEIKTLEDQDKSYLLGFYLLDLVGERFLEDILKEGSEYRKDFQVDTVGKPPKGAKAPELEPPTDGGAPPQASPQLGTGKRFEFVPPLKKDSPVAKEPQDESK
jgi:hypothetical protein